MPHVPRPRQRVRLVAASLFPAALITVGLLVSVQLGGNWTWLAAAFVLALVAGLVVGLLEYRGPGPVDVEVMRAHLSAGREAELETHLREAADRRDAQRRWGARIQLVELLLAERRTADAAVELDAESTPVPAVLAASAALCRDADDALPRSDHTEVFRYLEGLRMTAEK